MSLVDMSTPVTRGELREELALFDQKLDLWGGALRGQIAETEKRMDRLEHRFAEMETRLSAEIKQHVNAGFEAMKSLFTALDDKYRDLPARVDRLEARTRKRR